MTAFVDPVARIDATERSRGVEAGRAYIRRCLRVGPGVHTEASVRRFVRDHGPRIAHEHRVPWSTRRVFLDGFREGMLAEHTLRLESERASR